MSETLVNGSGYKIIKRETMVDDMEYDVVLYLTGEHSVVTKASSLRTMIDFGFDLGNIEKWTEVLESFIDVYADTESYDKSISALEYKYGS